MNKRKIATEASLLAAAPAFGYLMLRVYFQAAEENLSVPLSLGFDISISFVVGFYVLVVLAVIFWLSELLSRLVPIKKKQALMMRIRRIVQASLLLCLCIFYVGAQLSTGWGPPLEILLGFVLFAGLPAFILAIREILIPFIKHRGLKTLNDRLLADRSTDHYTSAYKYYKSFLTPTSLGALIIPVFIIGAIVNSAGIKATDPKSPRDYIIVDSSPKQIVLIDYGDKWLTAVYDDSYPGMPAYRRQFSVIKSDDLGKDKFTVKHIKQLYVYPD